MKKETRKYAFNLLLIVLLTIFALWFALKDDASTVLNVLNSVSINALILLILYALLYNGIIGIILTYLTRQYKKDYRLKEGIVNGFVGSFFSGITPSASGGQIGQVYIFRKQGIKVSEAASILWLDFIVYQSVLMLYSALLMILKFSNYYSHYTFLFTLIFVGFLINFSVIGALWTMAKFPSLYEKISTVVIRCLAFLRIVKNKQEIHDKWQMQLKEFTREINSNKDNKKLIIKLIFLNIIRLTIYFSLPFVIGVILGVRPSDMPFVDVIALSSFVTMSNSFFPVPGASGGTEMMFVKLFSILVSSQYASSIMIIWRFATYHLVLLIGGMLFILEKRRQQKTEIE